jgi:A/G-specific adenine glycosylase
MSFKTDQESLRNWFLNTKRDFPWRKEVDPYRVLISEVMLQQTRADVVVPYFERWMRLFPTVQALKEAPLEKVLKAWEGLGYYSRARNLHKAAEALSNGFPQIYSELLAIKGIGPYTANAIESFAFHKKVIAMDANVERVLSRYFALKCTKEAKNLAEEQLSASRPQEIAEGLIELGARICTKKPACGNCPIAGGCRAFNEGSIAQFPLPKKRKEIEELFLETIIYQYKNRFGVQQRKKGELFADLFLFHEKKTTKKNFDELCQITVFKKVIATATCYRFKLIPRLEVVGAPLEGLEFLTLDECLKRPFTSGHKRILHQLVIYFEREKNG